MIAAPAGQMWRALAGHVSACCMGSTGWIYQPGTPMRREPPRRPLQAGAEDERHYRARGMNNPPAVPSTDHRLTQMLTSPSDARGASQRADGLDTVNPFLAH